MRDRPPWIGWSRNRSEASPSPVRPPRPSGMNTESTLSTHRATWISPWRWNDLFGSWMVPWLFLMALLELNHKVRPCGVRLTSTTCPECALCNSDAWKRQCIGLKSGIAAITILCHTVPNRNLCWSPLIHFDTPIYFNDLQWNPWPGSDPRSEVYSYSHTSYQITWSQVIHFIPFN